MMAFNPFPNKPWFLRVYSTSLSKTLWEKEKLLVTSNFFFSHGVFYPFGKLSAIFINFEIVVCKLFQFEKFVVWERVKGRILFCSVVLAFDTLTLSQTTNSRLFQTERVCRQQSILNLMNITKSSPKG